VSPTTAERRLADWCDEFFGEEHLTVNLFMSFGYFDDGGPLGPDATRVLLAGQVR
jgi:hypothetical protein